MTDESRHHIMQRRFGSACDHIRPLKFWAAGRRKKKEAAR
jgi:hypothetical protein